MSHASYCGAILGLSWRRFHHYYLFSTRFRSSRERLFDAGRYAILLCDLQTTRTQSQWGNPYLRKVAIKCVTNWSERWPNHGRILSPFISVLCHSEWVFHGESCPRIDVVHPGCAWSSSPSCTWHCSLHYLFRQLPSFLMVWP